MSTDQITIRLPKARVAALKQAARAEHRSLAQQVEHLLASIDDLGDDPRAFFVQSRVKTQSEPEELTREPDPDHLAHENRPVGSPATKALALMRGRPTDFPAKPLGQKTVKPKGRRT